VDVDVWSVACVVSQRKTKQFSFFQWLILIQQNFIVISSKPYLKEGIFLGVRFKIKGLKDRVIVFNHQEVLSHLETRGIPAIRTTEVIWTNEDGTPVIEHNLTFGKGNRVTIEKIDVYEAYKPMRKPTFAEQVSYKKALTAELVMKDLVVENNLLKEALEENQKLKEAVRALSLRLDNLSGRESGLITSGVKAS